MGVSLVCFFLSGVSCSPFQDHVEQLALAMQFRPDPGEPDWHPGLASVQPAALLKRCRYARAAFGRACRDQRPMETALVAQNSWFTHPCELWQLQSPCWEIRLQSQLGFPSRQVGELLVISCGLRVWLMSFGASGFGM